MGERALDSSWTAASRSSALPSAPEETVTSAGPTYLFQPLHRIHPPGENLEARRRLRRQPLGGAAKRVFDILAAGGTLAILAPVLLIVAGAIMLESPGPALFLQRRGGLHGRPFLILKFRTMTTLDDGKVVSQAVDNDPRVTRLGSFLRATNVDELPQLINVLRGEMSLVGPRPHAIAHDKRFEQIDVRYRRRYRARPGITGLAQVSGHRGLAEDDRSVKARISHDLAYIERWSIWLDLWILLRTPLALPSLLRRSKVQQRPVEE